MFGRALGRVMIKPWDMMGIISSPYATGPSTELTRNAAARGLTTIKGEEEGRYLEGSGHRTSTAIIK
jgi:hypothetical protein